MCKEHLEMMRKSTSKETRVPLTTAAAQLVPASQDRVYLQIGPVDQIINVGTEPGVSATVGMPVGSQGLMMMQLNIFDHGDIVRKAWYGATQAGTYTASVIETFLPSQFPTPGTNPFPTRPPNVAPIEAHNPRGNWR